MVRGDVARIEGSRSGLIDWLDWMGFVESGTKSRLDHLIGYYESYAARHASSIAIKACGKKWLM